MTKIAHVTVYSVEFQTTVTPTKWLDDDKLAKRLCNCFISET